MVQLDTWNGRGRTVSLLYSCLLVSPGFIPILAPYLPFQDWPAHIGVAAVKHWLDMGQALPEAYAFRGWIGPNRLSYLLGQLLGGVLDPHAAGNAVLACFMALLGPSTHFAIARAGGDPRWALCSLPFVVGRVAACGFGPNVMALPLAMVSLGIYFRLDRHRLKSLALLVLALGGVLTMHLFVFLSLIGLMGMSACIDTLRDTTRRRGIDTLVVCVCMCVVMKLVAFVPQPDVGPSAFSAVVGAIAWPRLAELGPSFWEWLFAYFRRGRWDDVLQALWLAGVLSAAVIAAVQGGGGASARRLVVMVTCVLAAFCVLPENIGAPVNWWGGNLRLPTMAGLLAVTYSSFADGRLARYVRYSASSASVVFVGVATWLVVDFSNNEMAGFAKVAHAVPAGSRVCALHYSPDRVHEFPGEPHWYAANYLLAMKPVGVDHGLFGNVGEPVSRPRDISAPGWGVAQHFSWVAHAGWCDSFVVRYQASEAGQPFSGQAPECVELVADEPPWRVYRRIRVGDRCK